MMFDEAVKHKVALLNDKLLKSPDVVNGLIGLLIRFRKGKCDVTTDIEHLVYQIFLLERDRDVLHFLWRNTPLDKIGNYVMNVYLFGKIDSPCCANWLL